LRISEVARRVGISSSALRAWEALGLVTPLRTQSRYRLYTEADVRSLQRAIFLRRVRGLILPLSFMAETPGRCSPLRKFRRIRSAFSAPANAPRLSLAQVARATGDPWISQRPRARQLRSSIATLRRIARFYPHQHPLAFRNCR